MSPNLLTAALTTAVLQTNVVYVRMQPRPVAVERPVPAPATPRFDHVAVTVDRMQRFPIRIEEAR